VWLYLRFNLSLRDVGDLLAERGLDVSYETLRRWVARAYRSVVGSLRDPDTGVNMLYLFVLE